MRLALVLGTNKEMTQKLDGRIRGMRDNIQTSYFTSIDELLNYSAQRNISFERIILISSVLNSKVLMSDFYKYWSETNTNTSVILVARKGHDEDMCKYFLNTFSTPLVACMLLQATTFQTLGEAVVLTPAELNSKYGIEDHMQIEENTRFKYVPDSTQTPKEEKVDKPSIENSNNQSTGKKKGFFSNLFGKKSKIAKGQESEIAEGQESSTVIAEQENTTQAQEILHQDNYNQEDLGQSDLSRDGLNYIPSNMESESYPQKQENKGVSYSEVETPNFETELNTEFSESTTKDEIPQGDINLEGDIDIGIEDTTDSDIIRENQVSDSTPNSEVNYDITYDNSSPVEEPDISIDFTGSNFSDDANNEIPAENESDLDAMESETVDEDFSNFSISYVPEESADTTSSVEEVTDDMDLSGVAQAEDAYQEAANQPRIVEKVVVKEVVRNINTDKKFSALVNVLSGKNKKIILVTGDRGTGVTSTAIALAKTMSEKVSTLLVDFDVDNHGLLSYINYDEFRNYQGVPMSGIKFCNSDKMFNNCIVSYEHNLDLLTSDYSCDVTDDELVQAQGVVAGQSDNYNVVIIDCPISKLPLMTDLILLGNTILCVEESKRGFMNMLCTLEACQLHDKYKRMIISRGNMFLTKCLSGTDTKKLLKYIDAIYESSGIDWMHMDITKFNGRFSKETLNKVFEA